jgi:hypothetical protein
MKQAALSAKGGQRERAGSNEPPRRCVQPHSIFAELYIRSQA